MLDLIHIVESIVLVGTGHRLNLYVADTVRLYVMVTANGEFKLVSVTKQVREQSLLKV